MCLRNNYKEKLIIIVWYRQRVDSKHLVVTMHVCPSNMNLVFYIHSNTTYLLACLSQRMIFVLSKY